MKEGYCGVSQGSLSIYYTQGVYYSSTYASKIEVLLQYQFLDIDTCKNLLHVGQ